MAKGWYIVHTYSGYENKVLRHIRILVDKGGLKDRIFDIKVPSEEVVEIKDGKKKISTKKFLPGYLMVEMDLPEQGWKEICQGIRLIPGVTGFVGSSRNQKPQPISQDEARTVLQKSGDIKTERAPKPKQNFSVGEMVRIIDGPFESFTGNIEEVNMEKGKIRVMVGIFGRSTPVEVDFLQVEKI